MQLDLRSTVQAFGGPDHPTVMWLHNPRSQHTTHRTASSTQVQGWWQTQEAVQAAAADHETLIIRRPWNDDRRLGHISASEGRGIDVYWCAFLMTLFILHRMLHMASAFASPQGTCATAAFLAVHLVNKAYTLQ